MFLSGMISHVEVMLESPRLRRFFERVESFARVTLMDRVGTGLSDPLDGPTDLEAEVGDVVAVLDAVGAQRAAVLAYTSSAGLAVHVAAAVPERIRALILYAGIYRALADDGYGWALDAGQRRTVIDGMLRQWGTGENLGRLAPSLADDIPTKDWLGRLERSSASPGEMRRLAEGFGGTDVRALLPTLRCRPS